MKRTLAGLFAVLLLATVAELWAKPTLYDRRWQSKAGWTTVDSLGWRAGGHGVTTGRLYDSNIDTLIGNKADTTCPYPIDGAADVKVSVWNKKQTGGETVTYKVQVADDTVHWTSLGTTFTMAQTSGCAYDSASVQTILATVGTDSSYTGFNAASDRRKTSAASYLRVIASQGTATTVTTADTAIHCGTIKVRYPRDPKTR